MNMFEQAQVFAGKVVVVTGGSRGIGFAAVKEFLKAERKALMAEKRAKQQPKNKKKK